MTVLNIAFTKILTERKKVAPGGAVKINTNIGITNVEREDITLGAASQPGARFEFEFKVIYEPNIGEISINGEVIYIQAKEKIDALLDEWKKKKKVNEDVIVNVINRILGKCHVEALILSKELGLPAPIQLPKVGAKESSKV